MIHVRNRMRTAVLGVAGVVALIAPSPAHAVVANSTGVGGFDWDTGYRFTVCDKAADGRAVRAHLVLNGYTSDWVDDYSGNGTCKDSSREAVAEFHRAQEQQPHECFVPRRQRVGRIRTARVFSRRHFGSHRGPRVQTSARGCMNKRDRSAALRRRTTVGPTRPATSRPGLAAGSYR